MPRLDYKALVLALAAEIGADIVINMFVFAYFARALLAPDMSDAELDAVAKTVISTTNYLPWIMLFGTATTVGGAYIAARLAARLPYYHGLAMGLLAIAVNLVFWSSDAGGWNYFGLLITIPVSLYGAHLAKRHLAR